MRLAADAVSVIFSHALAAEVKTIFEIFAAREVQFQIIGNLLIGPKRRRALHPSDVNGRNGGPGSASVREALANCGGLETAVPRSPTGIIDPGYNNALTFQCFNESRWLTATAEAAEWAETAVLEWTLVWG